MKISKTIIYKLFQSSPTITCCLSLYTSFRVFVNKLRTVFISNRVKLLTYNKIKDKYKYEKNTLLIVFLIYFGM